MPPFCTPTTMKSGSRCASRAARDVLGSQPWYSAPAALLLATKVKEVTVAREPQSLQSVPLAQMAESLAGPPSSHETSLGKMQVFEQVVMVVTVVGEAAVADTHREVVE